MGDWRRPLLHMFHCGLMRPQKLGPVKSNTDGKGVSVGGAMYRAAECVQILQAYYQSTVKGMPDQQIPCVYKC